MEISLIRRQIAGSSEDCQESRIYMYRGESYIINLLDVSWEIKEL